MPVRVVIPVHLRTLAGVSGELAFDLPAPVTVRAIIDAIETRFPMLLGTIRDQATKKRRPLVRFFACEQDLSHDSPDDPLPEAVASGKEPFLIIGSMAGG